jgi:hypothetical protein
LFGAGFNIKRDNKGGVMATIWEHFESLVLQFLEDRTSELLSQGDVKPSRQLTARVREDAAWAAERAIARFQSANVGENSGKRRLIS